VLSVAGRGDRDRSRGLPVDSSALQNEATHPGFVQGNEGGRTAPGKSENCPPRSQD